MPAAVVGRTATELAAMVRAGEITARQCVAAHLEHLARVEPRLGAFASVRAEAALAEAEAVDQRRDRFALPLAGVPVAVKDVVDVSGERTRHGSRALPAGVAHHDDVLVRRLRRAGAVVVGKTRCPELSVWGTSDDVDGIAVSPWDPTRTAGGSSGGSGAAVAAGVVPIALASDGMGSIRIPAAATGTVGLKPGAGWLPDELARKPHWFGMSRFGPIATCAQDLRTALSALADQEVEVAIQGPLRVGVSLRSPSPAAPLSRPWALAVARAGRALAAAGHEVVRVEPPYDTRLTVEVLRRWSAGVAEDITTLGAERSRLQPRTRGHAALGERLARRRAIDEADAERWRARVAPTLAEVDVLLAPMLARTPPAAARWHERSWLANLASNAACYPCAPPWNLADVPAASVPVGSHRGRPTAVQVVSGQGGEPFVLRAMAELEQQVPWARHAPGWVPTSG